VLLVSHDLGVIAQMCDRVYVMYAGTIVERGPTQAVLLAPAHPYTRALLASRPAAHAPREPLFTLPAGGACAAGACAFRPRCPEAHARCDTAPPMLPVAGSAGVESRCWLHAAGREARE
jgi:oligopeptide/dipeptide ABC transporter ATP-binding protein